MSQETRPVRVEVRKWVEGFEGHNLTTRQIYVWPCSNCGAECRDRKADVTDERLATIFAGQVICGQCRFKARQRQAKQLAAAKKQAEKLHRRFDCAKCFQEVNTTKDELSRYWDGAELVCAACREPAAPGVVPLSAIWYPVKEPGVVMNWEFWNELFVDFIRQEWLNLEPKWLKARAEFQSLQLEAAQAQWQDELGGDCRQDSPLQKFIERALNFAELDREYRIFKPSYEWVESSPYAIDSPEAVGDHVDRIEDKGLVPGMGYVFRQFLSHRESLQPSWEAFVKAYRKWERKMLAAQRKADRD